MGDHGDDSPIRSLTVIIYAYLDRGDEEQLAVGEDADYPHYDPSGIHRDRVVVYVGQTMQKKGLAGRDAQHRSTYITPFDRSYVRREQYMLVKLEQRTFEIPATTELANEVDALWEPAEQWGNERETHYIKHHDTYLRGLNSTRGGQRGMVAALADGMMKRSWRRFKNVYMPFFRSYYGEHLNLQVPQSHEFGGLVSKIRHGHTRVPEAFREELAQMGVRANDDENRYAEQVLERWEAEYMPAFRWIFEKRRTLQLTPNEFIGQVDGHEVSLRNLVQNLRSVSDAGNRHTSIPLIHQRELLITMGFSLSHELDRRWDDELMPAFRKYHGEHGNLDIHTDGSVTIVVAGPNGAGARTVTVPLGVRASSIRSGNKLIPPRHRLELVQTLGFSFDNQASRQLMERWERVYMPEFRKLHTPGQPLKVPSDHSLCWLVSKLRSGEQTVPTKYATELLQTMDLCLDTQDTQRHDLWANEYMPAARAFCDGEGKGRLWDMTTTHQEPVDGKPVNIGAALNNRGKIPEPFQAELGAMGLADWLRKRELQAQRMFEALDEALTTYRTAQGHVLVPSSCKHACNGRFLGNVVAEVRNQGNYVVSHPDRRSRLNERGFLWHFHNLAAHAIGYAGAVIEAHKLDQCSVLALPLMETPWAVTGESSSDNENAAAKAVRMAVAEALEHVHVRWWPEWLEARRRKTLRRLPFGKHARLDDLTCLRRRYLEDLHVLRLSTSSGPSAE
jgi:hypothetical protein